jgi:hypothetical protein
MSDFLMTYSSSKSLSTKKTIYKMNNFSQGKYKIKLLNSVMKFKLPKITPISLLTTERDESSKKELLFNSNNEDDIKSYHKKAFNIVNKSPDNNKILSNTYFRNKRLSDIKKNSYNNPVNNSKYSLSLTNTIIKRHKNNSSEKDKQNFIILNSTNKIKKRLKTERIYTQKNKRKHIINNYVYKLMVDDEKEKNQYYPIYDKEKEGKNMKNKNIAPTKNTKKKILIEKTINKNNTFNNIKKINDNNKNNNDLLSFHSEFNNSNIQSLINQMFSCQYKIKNFYFGKNNYTHKHPIFKMHNIDLKNLLRKEEDKDKDDDYQLTFDEKINNAIIKAAIMENTFIKNKKIREKIINKIQKHCDNYESIIQKSLNS